MEESKDIQKITLAYVDGTEKVSDKGFLCSFEHEKNQTRVSFDMVHMAGSDLELMIEAVMQLALRIGYFDHLDARNAEENDE